MIKKTFQKLFGSIKSKFHKKLLLTYLSLKNSSFLRIKKKNWYDSVSMTNIKPLSDSIGLKNSGLVYFVIFEDRFGDLGATPELIQQKIELLLFRISILKKDIKFIQKQLRKVTKANQRIIRKLEKLRELEKLDDSSKIVLQERL